MIRLNINKILLMVLIGMLLGILFTFFEGTTIMLAVIAITTIALWNFLPNSDRRFLMALFITGISLRIIIFAIAYIISISKGGTGDLVPDSRFYTFRALYNLRAWTGETRYVNPIEGLVGENGYLYVLAFFYFLLGIHKLPLYNPVLFSEKLINCLIGTLAGIVIFYISKDIFGKKVAKIASLFAVFYPTFILWSITNIREPYNILLICLIIFSLVRLQKENKFRYYAIIFISVLLVESVRRYMFVPMLAVIGTSLLTIAWRNFKVKKVSILIPVIIMATLILNLTSYGRTIRDKFLNPKRIVGESFLMHRGIVFSGGPVYKIYDDYTEVPRGFKLIKGYFKGWIYFLFVPFPWTISSITQLMAYPAIIIWYTMFPFSLIGIFFAIRHRMIISFSLIFYLFLITSLYALSAGNIGAAIRHRDLVLIFYFIFSAAGLLRVLGTKILEVE
jgi:hypothetical protein